MENITIIDLAYLKDLALLAEENLNIIQCVNGRSTVDGYCCTHCGSENPEKICLGVSLEEYEKSLEGSKIIN